MNTDEKIQFFSRGDSGNGYVYGNKPFCVTCYCNLYWAVNAYLNGDLPITQRPDIAGQFTYPLPCALCGEEIK
jgi:hypothetical protein